MDESASAQAFARSEESERFDGPMSIGDASSAAGDYDIDAADLETAEVTDQVQRLQAKARYEPHNVHLGKAGGLNFGLQVSFAAYPCLPTNCRPRRAFPPLCTSRESDGSHLLSSYPVVSRFVASHLISPRL